MERDTLKVGDQIATDDFNSHAHVERDATEYGVGGKRMNFNSHAHVERDFLAWKRENGSKISTHTLTWSVTV